MLCNLNSVRNKTLHQKLPIVALGTNLGSILETLFSNLLCRVRALLQLTFNPDTLYFVTYNLQYIQ